MRKRNIQLLVRLNPAEHAALMRHVKRSGHSKEQYIRTLICGYIPREQPPADYNNLIQELQAIGRNINQLAAVANKTGHTSAQLFSEEAAKLRDATLNIQRAVLSPDRVTRHGTD